MHEAELDSSPWLPAVFALGGAIPLTPVLEPVADLGRGQPGQFGQVLLLTRRRVRIVRIPLAQSVARLLLEAVGRLLAVPDGPRQRKLASHSVLADGAERTTSRLFRLGVMRLNPVIHCSCYHAEITVATLLETIQSFNQSINFHTGPSGNRHCKDH